MGDENAGMGAEVGAKKIGPDGEVTDTTGAVSQGHSRVAWFIFFLMLFLSVFGVWQIIELLPL
jgi:hypothetical protein